MPVKSPYAPAFSWTGCYGVIEGGGIWGRTTYSSAPGGDTQVKEHPDGGTFGGTIGCNYQTGNLVWGIENDFGWAGISATKPQVPPFATAISIRTSTDWLDTLRGRVGISADRSLWYVTGGVAFTDAKGRESLAGAPTIDITHD